MLKVAPTVSELFQEGLQFHTCHTAYQIYWENLSITRQEQIKRGLIAMSFIVLVMCIGALIQITAKEFLENFKFRYGFMSQCPEIQAQFTTTDEFKYWASIDREYLTHSETTGIYQCYCEGKVGFLSFWKIWSDPEVEICTDYMSAMGGGNMMTVPLGLLNGVLTKLVIALSVVAISKVGFHSRASERQTTVVIATLTGYTMNALLPLVQFRSDYAVPRRYTPLWLVFFGKLQWTSMITQHLLPYLGVGLKFLLSYGWCCCPNKNFVKSDTYSADARYISILTLVFVTWTYGFSIPTLFEFAIDVLIIMFFFDKLLITFYYKKVVEHGDLLNRIVLKLMKYSIIAFLVWGGVAVSSNYCMISNQYEVLTYANEYLACRKFWGMTAVMIIFACLFLIGMLIFEDYTYKQNQRNTLVCADDRFNYF